MEIIVETFLKQGEPTKREIRVRPVAGQFKVNYRVWCSVQKRDVRPIGSLFRVQASFVNQFPKETYLRIDLNSGWIPVTADEAKRFISEQKQVVKS